MGLCQAIAQHLANQLQSDGESQRIQIRERAGFKDGKNRRKDRSLRVPYCREEKAKSSRNSLKARMKDPHEGNNQRRLPSLLNKSKDQGVEMRTVWI